MELKNMLRISMPHLITKNKKRFDLYFELLDMESRKNIVRDLKKGLSIKVPNFGNVTWKDLDEIEQGRVDYLLKAKATTTPLYRYDETSHEYKKTISARSVIANFLKLTGYDHDKLIQTSVEKPSIFQNTTYRLPSKGDLIDIDSSNLTAEEIFKGFFYTIVGRGILRDPEKKMIIRAIQMLCELFPNNTTYRDALKLADRKLNQSKQGYTSKEARDYSCITAPLPWDIAEKIRQWGMENIPDSDLINDGREPEVHVTVLYGLHGHDPYEIRPIINGFKPIKLILGEVSIFENEDQDVVKISVESPDLVRLNKIISDNFEFTKTHDKFSPHCTLAYVKPGHGKKYVGRKDFMGTEITINEILFSGNDYRETLFSFK